jgi:hypothetical protein
MVIIIFFGGILMGFLLGFSSMALLAARCYRLDCDDCQELEKVPVYLQAPPHPKAKRGPHVRLSVSSAEMSEPT